MSTRKNKGLSMGFASKQKSTLQTSNNRLDSKLVELQKNQEVLEIERQKLEELREQLEARDPSLSPVRLLPLVALHLSGDAQSRVFVNPSVVAEYIERMRFDEEAQLVVDPENSPWAPIRVYEDLKAGEGAPRYWVADGFHRVSAAEAIGITQIQCEVLPGSPRDAIRESLSANARHGLRRTREDKRRAVTRALRDADWRTWTDQRVADLCAVSRALVSTIRGELERAAEIPFEIALYGADGREFEREEPVIMDVVEVLAKRHAEADMSETTMTTNQKKETPQVSLTPPRGSTWRALEKTLARDAAVTTIIAYPTSAAHHESLCELASAHLQIERVIIPVMSGSEWLWRGPSLLDALTRHGFEQPVLVTIASLDRQFVCWAKAAHALSGEVHTIEQVRGERSSAMLVGKALDAW